MDPLPYRNISNLVEIGIGIEIAIAQGYLRSALYERLFHRTQQKINKEQLAGSVLRVAEVHVPAVSLNQLDIVVHR